MTTDSSPYIPFSQRTDLVPVPPQLKVGEVSAELRRLIYYFLDIEIDEHSIDGYNQRYLSDKWERVAKDYHVIFKGRDPDNFENGSYEFGQSLKKTIVQSSIGDLFDLVEFFVRHPLCSAPLKEGLTKAFVSTRAAYRIVDGQIAAIGTAEQAAAFERAIADAEVSGSGPAKAHLIAAGVALRNADWPGSVRESIHAVEAIARRLEPSANTLGPALIALEKRGRLHGSLKAAFSALYGYSSDEEGVRHALVFNDEAQVDEADALFMLGACASFVSYLLARSGQANGPA